MCWKAVPLMAIALLGTGCDRLPLKVAGPFYLDRRPETSEISLYRCPEGPGKGCAIDELPVLDVIAAGGSEGFVAVHSTAGYYYFRRIDRERAGWGHKPEIVIGPLSEAEFAVASRKLGLPDLDIRP